ncbi:MAG TPA: hypothetical protein VK997_11355 [Deferrisomatales bacterium]|nr:hypothetical protein [Deferrisomatales bacterium]
MGCIDTLLQTLVELGGSDLPLSAEAPPVFRVGGVLQRARHQDISAEDVQDLLYEILSDDEIDGLETHKDLDFGYGVEGLGRFPIGQARRVDSHVGAGAGAVHAVEDRLDLLAQRDHHPQRTADPGSHLRQ